MNQNFLDIGTNGLSDCLTRDGQAGMTAAFKAISGSVGAPSITFTGDATSGLYLVTSGNPALAAGGVKAMNWTSVATVSNLQEIKAGILSPTQITVTPQNNYSPTGLDTASSLFLTSNLNATITGIPGTAAGAAPTAGRVIRIVNNNALLGSNIVLSNNSSSSTAANRFSMGGDLTLAPQQAAELFYDGTDTHWQLIGSFNFTGIAFQIPQFRLTITSGTPVLTTDTTGQTVVYYTPYQGGYVTTWDGSVWTGSVQTEVSQTLADTTKSPIAAAPSTNYDMFYWLDSGTFRCTRGPAWTSATARGTGAGTTELQQVNGVWLNKVSITNGPAANRGIYVGTIRTNATGANGQVDMMFSPAAAAGGTNNNLFVWNMYNRVDVASLSRDSTDSWNYTTATWRAANAAGTGSGLLNRINLIVGLNEDTASAAYTSFSSQTGNNTFSCGVGLDATNAFSGLPASGGAAGAGAVITSLTATYKGFLGLGNHFIQALEYSAAAGTTTFYGDNAAPTVTQMGLYLTWRM